MSILVDTNVLLRRTQPDHAYHLVAVESIARSLPDGAFSIPRWMARLLGLAANC